MTDTPTPWTEQVSKGELRRLTQHLTTAMERLEKAESILDGSGVPMDAEEYGYVYDLTSARSYTLDALIETQQAYKNRREGGDADDA